MRTGREPPGPGAPSLARRVLVVDDEPGVAETLRSILRRCGCQVDVAFDGRAAVDAVERHHFDLVLMDIRMPRLDGLGALRLIRRWTDGPPVALMSAHATPSMVEAAYAAGAVMVFTKPADLDQVLSVVARVAARQSVLVCHGDPRWADGCASDLRSRGRSVRVAATVGCAREAGAQPCTTDVILLDTELPGALSAETLASLGAHSAVVLVAPGTATLPEAISGYHVIAQTADIDHTTAILDALRVTEAMTAR